MHHPALIVAALLVFASGAHAADPPPAERGETRQSAVAMTLLCWQAGRTILEERDIIAISPVGRGMAFYRRDGSHSDTIRAEPFLVQLDALRAGLPAGMPLPDIMLEVKDKNLSAVKANLLAGAFVRPDARGTVRRLETEWARYKYAVLARSERDYDATRQLLKDKAPENLKGFVLAFYRTVEQALARPEDPGAEVNAAQHVWGYFKKTATPADRKRFETLLARYRSGDAASTRIRSLLGRLADREGERYLQEGYYFLG